MVLISSYFSVVSSALLFADYCIAGVVKVPKGPKKSAIPTELYNALSLYEQYAAASYCPDVDGGKPGIPITCSTGNCPLVTAANSSIVLGIPTSTTYDTASYVGISPANKLIIVSFRGSESARNYLADADLTLVSIPTCPECSGFRGIYNAWSEVRTEIADAVSQAVKANPGYTVLSTGHSLGAGIATFAAVELRNAGFKVNMATFAGPRVGNKAFADYVVAQAPSKGENYRVTHLWDPVPDVPSQSSGYVHILPGYYISSGNDVVVTPEDIELQATDIPPPSAPTSGEGQTAHSWYFNHVSACYPVICDICVPWKS